MLIYTIFICRIQLQRYTIFVRFSIFIAPIYKIQLFIFNNTM